MTEEARGITVARYLAKRGAGLSPAEFSELALAMASRVAELHAHGWIHGEIGPASFVISSEDTTGALPSLDRVSLSESSRATRTDEPPRSATEVDGPLLYVAPERTGRMQTPFDHRADLYSLGATFYQMLTGIPPFPWEDPVRVLHGHVAIVPSAPQAVIASVPGLLSDLAMRLLEKMPEHRYQTASAVVDDLREIRERLRRSGEVGTFELGRTDPGRRLGAPRALYGRGVEARALGAALERCARGARELVLVEGPAGIGKTALVSRVLARHRWGGSKKFEALGTSRPFATIAEPRGSQSPARRPAAPALRSVARPRQVRRRSSCANTGRRALAEAHASGDRRARSKRAAACPRCRWTYDTASSSVCSGRARSSRCRSLRGAERPAL